MMKPGLQGNCSQAEKPQEAGLGGACLLESSKPSEREEEK